MSAAPARWERAALTVLPTALGAGVFAVAFVHVHDVAQWAGQPEWASWMLACTGELMAIAAGAAILACRRHKTSIFWPVVVLLAAIAFSGACNLQAAGEDALDDDPGQWVQIMAIWPVIAFGLVSLLKVSTPHGDHEGQADVAQDRRPAGGDGDGPTQPAAAPAVVPAPTPEVVRVTVAARPVEPAPSVPNGSVPAGTEAQDGAVRNGSATRSRSAASRSRSGSGSRAGTTGARSGSRSAGAAATRTRRQYPDDAALTEAARAAGPRLAERGELTRDGLRAELGVSAERAGRVLPAAREAAAANVAGETAAPAVVVGEVDEVTGWVPATPELIAAPSAVPALPALAASASGGGHGD